MRLLWRAILILTAVNLTLIASIRAQDEHYPALESVLMPPADCNMPCFLGIEIGETRASEAIAMLEAHPYVGDVQLHDADDRQVYSVRWYWAEDAPRYLAGFRNNVMELDAREVVSGMTMYVFIPTGQVWRYIDTHTTQQGEPLSDHIRVDGPNCIYDILAYYQAVPQRIFYVPTPSEHPIPYRPLRSIPPSLRC